MRTDFSYPFFPMMTLLTCGGFLLSAGRSLAAPAAKTKTAVARLAITPGAVNLTGPRAAPRLLVTAIMTDGTRRDVTEAAAFRSANPKIAVVSRSGEITGRGDGRAKILVQWRNQTAQIAAVVSGTKRVEPVSFVNDVVPILSRTGCSQGTCHGAASGKGGFRLSLRGYAPELDFLAITRQLGGRRITRENPAASLLLRKPLLEVTHRGGKRFDTASREYSLLLQWLREGAPGPTGKEPELTKLEILPGDRQMRPKETQRLLVRATFADGHSEDVTGRALYNSNDVALATVDEMGKVTMQREGETAITTKYMDKMAVIRVLSPFAQKVSEAAYRPSNNYIDPLANAKLKQLNIEPSGLCADAEFLRRAYIDAIGTLPTAEEARAFLDSKAANKRDALIDALLRRPEYGQVWALKFGDLFTLRREYMRRKYAMLLQQWLAEQFNSNRGWDKIATDILTASGDLDTHRGGLFFISRAPQKPNEEYWIRAPQATSEMVAQVFLGTRIQCAKCHNHPTERYTQDDYYHFSALWQQLHGKGENDDGVPETLTATANGDTRQPRTNELMAPRPLDRADLRFTKDEDRRVKAAAWLVGQDEFARNIVNRCWARHFGSGIIEPVDDIRSTNPAKNEPLMRALCADLRRHNFDLKYLTATIMKSRTYQRSALPNRANRNDTRLFSHYLARRLPAEELADAVAQVTGVPDRYDGMTTGSRAIEIADTEIPSLLLDTFGRPPRVQPSDSERNCNPAISQALALLNGDALQQKLKAPDSVLPALLKSGASAAVILDTLFLAALSRRPTSTESRALLALIAKAPAKAEGFQDALWAILNSKEFLFDH